MAIAVICEFNPFHNGHKYLINKAKEFVNEPVIAIMSGSFTQRGEAAVTDKFSRAKTALKNGADIVLELPTVYSVANAQLFAECGTYIARSFDCVNYLTFGCETDDITQLMNAADSADNTDVQKIIKNEMKRGGYYPRALENAVRQILGDATADIFTSPNNILAVEYIRGLKKSNVKPLPVKRTAVEHDSFAPSGNFASASYIRELIRGKKSASAFMPCEIKNVTFPENLERILLYRLRSMSPEDFSRLPDVCEGLENRIFNSVKEYNSVKEITDNIKTKRYTHARICRILTCALLGITKQMQTAPVEYVRVLGFNNEGAKLLKSCRLNVITSVSEGVKLGGNIKKLLEKDIFATDIAALAYNNIEKCKSDFITPIIKI